MTARPSTQRLDSPDAVALLAALAQPTRLEIFRLLMRYRPHGLAAGDIGRLLAVAHNTLSSHLNALEQVGLLVSRREGRHIIFAAQAPRADALLADLGYDVSAMRSKSWDEFLALGSCELDLVVTVCDDAAEASCPAFPGVPMRVHWGLDDPAAATGPESAKRAAFLRSYRDLAARVSAFVNLPFEQMTPDELQPVLTAIGRMDGATARSLDHAA